MHNHKTKCNRRICPRLSICDQRLGFNVVCRKDCESVCDVLNTVFTGTNVTPIVHIPSWEVKFVRGRSLMKRPSVDIEM